jgi:5-formyltetrahydrofolate cyclo-ligase
MQADIGQAKEQLRARIRQRRARRVREGPAAAAAVAAGLLLSFRAARQVPGGRGLLPGGGRAAPAAPAGPGGAAIAAYLALRGEPDPVRVCTEVRTTGGVVLLPIPLPDRELAWAHDDGRHGAMSAPVRVPVPLGDRVGVGAAALHAHGVAVLLIPALAVDRSGRRLGQGGGYYDRLLGELAELGDPGDEGVRVVAVVHDDEVLDAGDIPIEPHDRVVHAALTPGGFQPLGPGAG